MKFHGGVYADGAFSLVLVCGCLYFPRVMTDEPITTIENFLEALRMRFPEIRAYGEEDWDWTWADEGFELLEAEDYDLAELKFQQLIVAQPEHGDGYEGLALVYKETGRGEDAVLLIDEAVRLARLHIAKGYLDSSVADELLRERDEILQTFR